MVFHVVRCSVVASCGKQCCGQYGTGNGAAVRVTARTSNVENVKPVTHKLGRKKKKEEAAGRKGRWKLRDGKRVWDREEGEQREESRRKRRAMHCTAWVCVGYHRRSHHHDAHHHHHHHHSPYHPPLQSHRTAPHHHFILSLHPFSSPPAIRHSSHCTGSLLCLPSTAFISPLPRLPLRESCVLL